MSAAKPTSSNQGDLLLWIAGGAIAAVGAAWLVITQPWTQQRRGRAGSTLAHAPTPVGGGVAGTDDRGRGSCRRRAALAPDATLDNPLRMARARVRRRHARSSPRNTARGRCSRGVLKTRAGQRGRPRGSDEGRRRSRAPRRDRARSGPLRRRARDRRAHSRRPARARGRQGAGAEDLARTSRP